MSFNASRRIVGGYSLNDTYDERRQQSRQASPPVLQRAVVIDVICDPRTLTDEIKADLKNSVNNYELVEVLPPNSVIAQLINDDLGNLGITRTILFPFFQSHIQLPVNPGEVVHVIYQDFVGKGTKVGFWLSRIHGNRSVEDVNYTHLDRQFDPNNNFGNWTTSDKSNAKSSTYTPNFPNGGNTLTTYTLSPEKGSDKPFDDIVAGAIASQFTKFEEVPRWHKRPGEFVIQGSNNALILLGNDRQGPVDFTENDIRDYSGTVDIVVGRGRYAPASAEEDPTGTAPRVVKNSRNTLETDKAPFRGANPDGTRKQDNANEGNPDFTNDAARLLVSMQTKGDEKFGVTEIEFPSNTIPIKQPEPSDGGKFNRSYVIGKSDHIRFISRKNNDKGIEGSILLLREGDSSDDKDLGYLFINKHGFQIEANKIYLGKAAKKNPEDGITDNEFNNDQNGYEPYILWSKYKSTVDSLQKQIKQLEEDHQKAIKDLKNEIKDVFSNISKMFAANLAIPYSQNPAITAVQNYLNVVPNTLFIKGEANLRQTGTDIDQEQNNNMNDNVDRKNHSQKIYGE